MKWVVADPFQQLDKMIQCPVTMLQIGNTRRKYEWKMENYHFTGTKNT